MLKTETSIVLEPYNLSVSIADILFNQYVTITTHVVLEKHFKNPRESQPKQEKIAFFSFYLMYQI